MNLRIMRLQNYNDYTIGALYIDGQLEAFTMEDEKRNVKIMSETRIPSGVYKLELRTLGSLHLKYSRKFQFHKGMIWLRNVPNFEYIYIHIGNTDDDTSGCILVGNSHYIGKNLISDSTKAYERIYSKIADAISSGQSVTIQVVDELHL